MMAFLLVGLFSIVGVALVLLSQRQAEEGSPCAKCRRIMMPDWQKCLFCGASPDLEAGRQAALHFVSGPLQGQAVLLGKPVVTIGSVPGNDVVLSDTGVSRKHVGIRKVDGGYELADFGSTNGVFVNGEKTPKKKLNLGDIIRVGNTEIIFRVA